ncbi:MAG: hypothetical protein AAFR65_04715 [Pseudomonadota bacterium]
MPARVVAVSTIDATDEQSRQRMFDEVAEERRDLGAEMGLADLLKAPTKTLHPSERARRIGIIASPSLHTCKEVAAAAGA